MPIDKNRDMWKPGMPWEQAIDDMKYVRDSQPNWAVRSA